MAGLGEDRVDGDECDAGRDVEVAERPEAALDPGGLRGVSLAGLVPVSTGTAPSGAWRASRAPWTR